MHHVIMAHIIYVYLGNINYILMHIKGKFIRKPLCYGSLEFLNSQWQRVTRTCALGLHEDKFGPQPISMDG